MSRPIPRRNLRPANVRTLGKILYWLAVLVLSVVLLIVLVLFFESRDTSNVHGGAPEIALVAPPLASQWVEISAGWAG